jgi:hypothetical protein
MTVPTLSVGRVIFVVMRFMFASTLLGLAFASSVMVTSAVLWYALLILHQDGAKSRFARLLDELRCPRFGNALAEVLVFEEC